MRLIPKPEGYEMRDKRSTKANAADQWTPRDALFCASERMNEQCDAVTVIWRETLPDGGCLHHRSNAGPQGATLDLTITALGKEMGWTHG